VKYKYVEVIIIIIIIIYKDWAFWPVPFPGIVELVLSISSMVGLSPIFLLGDNQRASEEFCRSAFLKCDHNSFVDIQFFLNILLCKIVVYVVNHIIPYVTVSLWEESVATVF
jgi:hypothetical protein